MTLGIFSGLWISSSWFGYKYPRIPTVSFKHCRRTPRWTCIPMVNSGKKEILHMLYVQHGEPYGLSSRMKLWEKAKSINPAITQDDVRVFLRSNKTYTLHKLQNKKFPRQKIIASKPKVIMAADLADVRHIRKENNNNGWRTCLFKKQ